MSMTSDTSVFTGASGYSAEIEPVELARLSGVPDRDELFVARTRASTVGSQT